MPCVQVAGVILMLGTPNVTLRVNGKDYTFEFSDRFGPFFESKRGRELPSPREGSVFWKALKLWIDQGKRMDGPRCVWDAIEEQDILQNIGPRVFKAIGRKMAVPEWVIQEAE